MISNSLRQKHYSILVNAPENFAHNNGISVLLHAAQLLRSLGLSVSIVPADSSTPRFIRLPFGPSLESNRPVQELMATILQYGPGAWDDRSDPMASHEAALLHLQIDKCPPPVGLASSLALRHHDRPHGGLVSGRHKGGERPAELPGGSAGVSVSA